MESEKLDIDAFVSVIREGSGFDLSNYAYKSLQRRLARILTELDSDMPSLLRKMKKDPLFIERMVMECTISTTELFRDPQVWKLIRKDFLSQFHGEENINIWHAGCSTGQEVYSMLMLLDAEHMLRRGNVTATDLNPHYLDTAIQGCYKYRHNLQYLDNFDAVMKENPDRPDFLEEIPYDRYMIIDPSEDTIRMRQFLLEKPVFLQHDLVEGKRVNSGPYDLIMCRNVIIYFNFNLQNRVLQLLYSHLKKGGLLVLGPHESILGSLSDKFERCRMGYVKK